MVFNGWKHSKALLTSRKWLIYCWQNSMNIYWIQWFRLDAKNQPVVIHWFRRDLRLQDNTALFYALQSDFPVLPLLFSTKIFYLISRINLMPV